MKGQARDVDQSIASSIVAKKRSLSGKPWRWIWQFRTMALIGRLKAKNAKYSNVSASLFWTLRRNKERVTLVQFAAKSCAFVAIKIEASIFFWNPAHHDLKFKLEGLDGLEVMDEVFNDLVNFNEEQSGRIFPGFFFAGSAKNRNFYFSFLFLIKRTQFWTPEWHFAATWEYAVFENPRLLPVQCVQKSDYFQCLPINMYTVDSLQIFAHSRLETIWTMLALSANEII